MLAFPRGVKYEHRVNSQLNESCSQLPHKTGSSKAGRAFGSLTHSRPSRDNEGRSAGVTQLVECDLAKVDVAGSNPVSRSISPEHSRNIPLKFSVYHQ